VDDLIHVYMLIFQELWKNPFNHSNITEKHGIIVGISIHYNKCKMQHVNTSFNILKVNGCIHEHILIIEKMWKKSLIHQYTYENLSCYIPFNKLW